MTDKPAYLVIGAAPFIIDPVKRELVQFNNNDHIIRFDDLKEEDGYYSAKFDKNRDKLSTEWLEFGKDYYHILNVIIPAPIIDAPGSLTPEFIQDLNHLGHDKEWGFYLADHDTALRLSGMLPHIDLAGTDFTIDWCLKELRETDEPWNRISLKDMDMSDSGEEYLCFYNTDTHELFEPDEDLFEMPENVVVLEIPYEVKLDPVAVAREYGIGETDLLPDHPFQMKLTAKVTPLSETGLSNFIEENIKNRDEEQHEQEQRNRRGR